MLTSSSVRGAPASPKTQQIPLHFERSQQNFSEIISLDIKQLSTIIILRKLIKTLLLLHRKNLVYNAFILKKGLRK